MPSSPLSWLILAALFLCFVLIAVLGLYARNIKEKLMQSIGLIGDLHALSDRQSKAIDALQADMRTELHESLKQTKTAQTRGEASLSDVCERIEKNESSVERVGEQDPALKMYSRSSKLVAQGAAMEDIIEASGLPRAEVEVLMSLHSQK